MVDDVLRTLGFQPRELSFADLSKYRPRPIVAGWRISLSWEGGLTRELDVLVETGGSLRVPLVALVAPPEFLTWPHVEKDGVLCLGTDDDALNLSDPRSVIKRALSDAAALVDDCIAGRCDGDFLAEATSYWNHARSDGSSIVVSLLNLLGPSREVFFWQSKTTVVVGDSPAQIEKWVRNRFADHQMRVKTSDALFVLMPRPLYPYEFPHTSADVDALVAQMAPTLSPSLDGLAAQADKMLPIILAAQTDSGPFSGAILMTRPQKNVPNGFRPGRVPPAILRSHVFGQQKILRCEVTRMDAAWVHGRDRDWAYPVLREKSVAVVGCGSLGAHVAMLLAQSGVGRFVLVDPQELKAANISRHPLGAQYVGRPKVGGLAEEIGRRFPDVGDIVAHRVEWEQLDFASMSSVVGADLVIVAIGATPSELALSSLLRRAPESPPTIFGWLEPFAVATHAVAVAGRGPCFRCFFTERGIPALRATDWEGSSTVVQEPACGAVFQPYGMTELQNAVTLVVELAAEALLGQVQLPTHRVRVAPKRTLTAAGGRWTADWVTATRRDDGGFTWEPVCEVRPTCPERH